MIVNQPVTFRGETLLHLAVRMNEPYLVEQLVKVGARLNQADKRGNTPQQLAALSSEKAVKKLFIKSGADRKIYHQVIALRQQKLKLLNQELLGLNTITGNLPIDIIDQIKTIASAKDNDNLLNKLIAMVKSKQAALSLFSGKNESEIKLNKLILLLDKNSQSLLEFELRLHEFKESFVLTSANIINATKK